MRTARAVVAASLVALLAGCTEQPSEPSIVFPTLIDTFSGNLAVGGTATHRFTINTPGQVTITLLKASPPDTVVVGFGVGTIASDQSCTLTNTLQTPAGPMPQIGGNAPNAGTFCLSIYDVGNLQQTVTYLIAVAHS